MSVSSFLKKQFANLIEAAEEAAKNVSNEGSETKPKEKTPLEELESFINEQYATAEHERPTLPDTPEYERMDATGMTDEEIKTKAEEKLAGYVNNAQTAIDDEITALEQKYNTDKGSAKELYDSSDATLGQIYGEAKENTSNDMLKRGLARSSISTNLITGLESELASERASVLKSYTDAIGTLDSQISNLEVKRQRALSEFNLAYAVKLTEEINSLTAERDDKQKEALKYNNSLTEKEYDQAVDKIMKESDLYTERLNQSEKENSPIKLSDKQQNAIYEAIYNKMEEMLSSMTPAEAKKFINSSSIFDDSLSDVYYYSLYDKYGR